MVIACLGLILFLGILEKPSQGPGLARVIRTVSDAFLSEFNVPVSAEAEPGKVVFPYSVIAGGARNREELQAAIDRDPVVAQHYAGFKAENTRLVRAQTPQLVHVSYRIQSRVFWTAKKIQLLQGEMLISDGLILARTRCGNQVSAVPQEPVSEVEPPPEVFNTPVIPVDAPLISETVPASVLDMEPSLPILEPLINPPELVTLESRFFDNITVPYVPNIYFPPTVVIQEFPSGSEVPEPATLILITSGLALPVLWRLCFRRN